MSTLQYTKLADIQYVADSAGSLYANPSSKTTYIRSLVLYNNNSTPETVTLYNVPDSASALGTAGAGNEFFQKSLAPNETFVLEFNYPIVLTDENDSIQASTTTGSMVTAQILGDVAE